MTAILDLIGLNTYYISPATNTVQLSATEIENLSVISSSGTLRLELWLTPLPWTNYGSNYGWEVAIDRITGASNGTLGPLQYFSGVSATVPYINHPPAGTYYVTLAVTEYTDLNPSVDAGYSLDTSYTFSNFAVVNALGGYSDGGSIYAPPAMTYALNSGIM